MGHLDWPPELSSLFPSFGPYESYPVIIATLLRGQEWSINYIFICSDNPTAIDVINKGHSQSLDITKFLRHLTFISAKHQWIKHATQIHENCTSLFLFNKFKPLAADSDAHPMPIPPYSATVYILTLNSSTSSSHLSKQYPKILLSDYSGWCRFK